MPSSKSSVPPLATVVALAACGESPLDSGTATSEARFAFAEAKTSPGVDVCAEADSAALSTDAEVEEGGLLILQWSTAGTAREGDIVTLYDGPPEYPLEWVEIQYEDAAKSPPLFLTNERVEYGRYHVAYLRIGERGDYEIAARWGPYLEDHAPTDAATAAE